MNAAEVSMSYESIAEYVGERSDGRKFKRAGVYVRAYSRGGVVSLWVKEDMIAVLTARKVKLTVEYSQASPKHLKELAIMILADN